MVIKPRIETEVTEKYEKHKNPLFREELLELFIHDKPKICVLDSETTGLHIKKDKPFMWVFGWQIPKENRTFGIKGRTFAFEHDPDLLQKVVELASDCKVFVGHNIKYDLHMVMNGDVDPSPLYKNVTDTMCTARLSFEAVSARDGGDALGLKPITTKYIDYKGSIFEDAVKKELKQINDQRRKVLIALLKPYKGWGVGKLKDVYRWKKRGAVEYPTKERKQRWVEVPEEVQQIYFDWMEEYPPANYADVDPDIMMEYVHSDGIYTLELAEKSFRTVYARKQQNILKQENALIPVLLDQERQGLKTDMKYLKECDTALDTEIDRNYKELWELVGGYFTVSQDQVIADYYEKKNGERPSSTDKSFLKKQGDRVAKLITRLRRLEKWQSTYVSRIIEVSEYDGRFYTQFNAYSTVSGRVSSDAQQFPKDRILTEEGEKYEKEYGEGKAPKDMEIFNPRRAFIPDEGTKTTYFDYSQIELRVQSNYTILLGRPDKNLCRAYMPLSCRHFQQGSRYEYNSSEERSRWSETQYDGKTSAWITEECKPWKPTDVHSETTHNTLLQLGYDCWELYEDYQHSDRSPIDGETFKEYWRKKGKIINFSKNYGVGVETAAENLDLTLEIAKAMLDGWEAAFPEVAHYQEVTINTIWGQGYDENMYGRRYYLDDPRKGYKVANYKVQGSCADFLKRAMIKLYMWLKKNKLRTKMILNVHDEIAFKVPHGEEWIYPHIKRIMEECSWMLVPVVVDIEETETNWADKEEVKID